MLLIFIGVTTDYYCLSQENMDIFNIYFKQDFENDTPGTYDYDEYKKDWNYPSWEDREVPPEIVVSTDPAQPGKVMRFIFPKGGVGPGEGGGTWLCPLGKAYDELYFSYRVKFKPGFEPVLSGKLPGVIGSPEFPCCGSPGYYDGFRAKLTWNYWPDIVNYIYHHDLTQEYGDPYPIGYGLPTGKWFTLTNRIVMNSVGENGGNKDGIIETFVDGVLMFQKSDIVFRNVSDIGSDILEIVSFFGGEGDAFAAARDEWIELDDFVAFTYKDNVDVPKGNTLSSSNRVLILPDIYSSSIVDSVPHEQANPDTIIDQPAPQIPYIKVFASGTEFAGENAHFKLFLNKSQVGETYVTSADQAYIFNLDQNVGADDTITIHYDNDLYELSGGDRNLFIESININGTDYFPNAKNVVFLFDGDVLEGMDITYGSSILDYPGKLIFYLGRDEVSLEDVYPADRKENEIQQTSNQSPTISNQHIIVKSPLSANSTIGKIQASDKDQNQTLTFSIKSGNNENMFDINKNTGDLIANNIERLTDTLIYILSISVTDNGTEPMTSDALVTITILPSLSVIYIDPSNINDISKNGTEEHPYSSWQEVVWTSDYTYLQKRGTISNEGKINVYAEDVILGAYGEGELPIITSNAKDYAIRVFEKSNITIKDIHITADDAISCIYFMGSNSTNNTVENCVLEGANNGVRIIDGKTYTIKYTTIKGATDGIFSFALTNKIYYNIFRENQTAINISSNFSTADIFNNVFYGNASGVITTYAELTLYNNIFYLVNTGDMAINHSMDKLVSDNNIFYPESTGFLSINNKRYNSISEVQSDLNIDMNSFSKDPGFIDIYNDNFMVTEQSPAVDAGKYVGIPTDAYRQAEPYGTQPDIGLTELSVNNIINSISSNTRNKNEELLVYPNPSYGRFKVFYSNGMSSSTVLMVTDVSGRTVYQTNLPSDNTSVADIDISDFPKGIYLLHLRNETKMLSEQIIIQ